MLPANRIEATGGFGEIRRCSLGRLFIERVDGECAPAPIEKINRNAAEQQNQAGDLLNPVCTGECRITVNSNGPDRQKPCQSVSSCANPEWTRHVGIGVA